MPPLGELFLIYLYKYQFKFSSRVMFYSKDVLGLIREEIHRIHMTRRMHHHTRCSMQLIEDSGFNLRSIIRVMLGSIYNIALVANIITCGIIHNIKVESCKSIVLRRCK